jgi:hypothetical protein
MNKRRHRSRRKDDKSRQEDALELGDELIRTGVGWNASFTQ